jgi:hypothetical protein
MLTTPGSTTPLNRVVATLNGKITNAMKLKNAAIETAAIGESTFVETMQAMELAES